MKETTCPPNKGISGTEIYEPPAESRGYIQYRGRSKNFVPTTTFCPQCSELYEYDKRFGEPKPKWSMNEHDYTFDISYATDKDGNSYVVCNSCNHDFRNEVKFIGPSDHNLTNKSEKKYKQGKTHNFVQEWLKNVKYNRGLYIMTIEEFKRMAEIGYKSKVVMNPCAKVGGVAQYIKWNDFLTHYEKLNIDGIKMIGLPRHKWKNL